MSKAPPDRYIGGPARDGYRCELCGAWIEFRDLREVLAHEGTPRSDPRLRHCHRGGTCPGIRSLRCRLSDQARRPADRDGLARGEYSEVFATRRCRRATRRGADPVRPAPEPGRIVDAVTKRGWHHRSTTPKRLDPVEAVPKNREFSRTSSGSPSTWVYKVRCASRLRTARRIGLVIRFLSIGPRLCSTLPSDPASRRRPCASLILRHHQAG
jgi:hypothetical protein